MTVGDTVYAVGNPLGELEFTMTSGMISALDRTITTSDGTDNGINMFQIDAAVNAGNSGGPVYNTSGQVIGIVTAKYSSSGVEGLGFAIPVNDAVAIANDLMKNGHRDRPRPARHHAADHPGQRRAVLQHAERRVCQRR